MFSTTGHTNAKSEARNLITEKVRRNAYDFHNFENYRLRPRRFKVAHDRRLCSGAQAYPSTESNPPAGLPTGA